MQHNLFGEFKIYPRGFLGARLDPVLARQAPRASSHRLQYDVSVFDANDSKTVTGNARIEELYNRLARQNGLQGNSFDFREEALKAVLHAFGTKDFTTWYLAQFQSPSFGDLHRRFIDDCLLFVQRGVRELPLTTWEALLDPSDSRDTDPFLSRRAKGYFNVARVSDLRADGNAKLASVIQDWFKQPGGFADLLTTSRILFGVKN